MAGGRECVGAEVQGPALAQGEGGRVVSSARKESVCFAGDG